MNESSKNKPHLLLVDDDKSLLRLLTIRLEGEGYQVTAVEDGNAALRKLQNDAFDVVLSDLRMPGLDGLSLFEEIKLNFILNKKKQLSNGKSKRII